MNPKRKKRCAGPEQATTTTGPEQATTTTTTYEPKYTPTETLRSRRTGRRRVLARHGRDVGDLFYHAAAATTDHKKTAVLKRLRERGNLLDVSDDVLKFIADEIEPIVARLCGEHTDLLARSTRGEHNARRSKSNLRRLQVATANAVKRNQRHTTTISTLVGKGFETKRTAREHALRWQRKIESTYCGDIVKQVEVAEAIYQRFRPVGLADTKETDAAEVAAAIGESFKEFVKKLREKHKGLEQKIMEMIRHGQENVAIADRLHRHPINTE